LWDFSLPARRVSTRLLRLNANKESKKQTAA
jgi:hypothetical protein